MDENTNNLHIFYRLSDKGEIKEKMPSVNNKSCLENFLQNFAPASIDLIADNVTDETFTWLKKYNVKKIHRTALGNVGSFWYCFQLAQTLPVNDYVYFVENDYIHKENSFSVLLEGLKLADYVTLYDHPDKYSDGINPLVRNGGEKTKVLLSDSTHWKITNSTTMTFASKVSVLRHDEFFFKLFTVGIVKEGFPLFKKLQKRRVPNDYRIFTLLHKYKKRDLISPIPGYSTHGELEYLSPFSDWENVLTKQTEPSLRTIKIK